MKMIGRSFTVLAWFTAIVGGLFSLLINISVIHGIFGPIAAIIALIVFPAALILAPWIAVFAWDTWIPLVVTYGTGFSAYVWHVLGVLIAKQQSETAVTATSSKSTPRATPPELASLAQFPPGMRTRIHEYDLAGSRSLLERHTRLLLKAFGSQLARQAPIQFPPQTDEDRLSYLKEVVRLAARRYHVRLDGRVHVRFAALPVGEEAGSIKEEQGVFKIDVLDRFREDDWALTVIAVHEMAHYALAKAGIRLTDLDEYENLTDALAVLAGFGPLMLQVYHQEFSARHRNSIAYSVSTLGYLHPTAVAYLTLLQNEIAGLTAEKSLDLKNPWYSIPWRFRQTVLQSSDSGCRICGEPLPPADPGTVGITRCLVCHVLQPASSAQER